jgi:hypothetical protein
VIPDELWRLEDRVLRDTGNRREHVLALAADGRIIFEKTGGPQSVALTRAELEALRGLVDILTHNHPSSVGIGLADYDIAVDLDVREIHAFGQHVRYRLVRPVAGWPNLRTTLLEMEAIRRVVRRRLNAALRSGTITVEEYGLRYWHEIWLRFTHRHPEVGYSREER